MDIAALQRAGFAPDDSLEEKQVLAADKYAMHDSGEYKVEGAFRRGSVVLLFEQNTAAEPLAGGLAVTISHPAVCVLSGPNGRVACNAADTELILTLADELA